MSMTEALGKVLEEIKQEEQTELDKLIKECGMGLRSLTLHTDGTWTAKSGRRATPKNMLFGGATPEIALEKLLKAIKKYENPRIQV